MVTRGGGGAMVTMAGFFRAGQPTNAVVIKRALAMAMVLTTSGRFFIGLPPPTKCGGGVGTQRGSGQTTARAGGGSAGARHWLLGTGPALVWATGVPRPKRAPAEPGARRSDTPRLR